MTIKFKALREGVPEPRRGSKQSAGIDLYAAERAVLWEGQVTLIPTGYAVEIPAGFVGLIKDRSSVALRGSHTIAGVIDSDYRGELIVAMVTAEFKGKVEKGERFAQLIIIPCLMGHSEVVDELSETKRGAGGFGSTGDK